MKVPVAMRWKILCGIMALAWWCGWAPAAAAAGKLVWPENGHMYQRIDEPLGWSGAVAYCEQLGGHLVTITSAKENDFLYRTFGIDGVNIWLGATDRDTEGVWQWITGEPWQYDNWSSSANSAQPDDAGRGQDYAIFWDLSPGEWDDNGLPEGDYRNVFICEWEPAL
jgi:hypothetical protein